MAQLTDRWRPSPHTRPQPRCDACGRTDTCLETHTRDGVALRVCVQTVQCRWRQVEQSRQPLVGAW